MDTKLRALPPEERLRLIEDLWDSIAADHNASRPAGDVIADIRRKL